MPRSPRLRWLPQAMAVEPTKYQVLERLTKTHYDTYPFEFLTPRDEVSIRSLQPRPFLNFVETYARGGMSVAEIGCGPGRATMYLEQRGFHVTAVDLSRTSIALARGRAPGTRFVQGNNLALPFADASFDLVVSDGVIHHTPDSFEAFAENVRVLGLGGYLYLAVYNRRRYYYYIYTYVGALVRLVERTRVGRAILVYAILFPPYYAVHLIKSQGRCTLRGARNFFYDYMITPRASFHTREEVEGWATKSSLDLLMYNTIGNVHAFVFRKRK